VSQGNFFLNVRRRARTLVPRATSIPTPTSPIYDEQLSDAINDAAAAAAPVVLAQYSDDEQRTCTRISYFFTFITHFYIFIFLYYFLMLFSLTTCK